MGSKSLNLNNKDLRSIGIYFLIVIATTALTASDDIKNLLVAYGIIPEMANMLVIMLGIFLKKFLENNATQQTRK